MGDNNVFSHDFNEDLGGKSFEKEYPDWKTQPFANLWGKYAGKVMGECLI